MARLPIPGQDQGTWGTILNDYLLTVHNGDGTLKNGVVSSASLQSNVVTAGKISATNSAANGQFLSYSNGNLTWATATGSSVTDHGALTGLGDDDHSQYHTDARGDARYYTKLQVDSALDGKANTSHTHAIADTTSLQTALDSKLNTSTLDIDSSLAANSDTRISSQKAIKTYVAAQLAGILPAQTGQSGKFLTTDGSTTAWAMVPSFSTSPGGANRQLQFNDNGALGGSNLLNVDAATGIVFTGTVINDASLPIQLNGNPSGQLGISRDNNYGLLLGSFDSSTYVVRVVDNYSKLSLIVNGATAALTAVPSGAVGIGTNNPTAQLDVNGDMKVAGQIHNVSDPTSAQDAATKAYVDAATAAPAKRITTLSDGAAITPNAATTDIARVTLGDNRTMAAPSGSPTDGQQLQLHLMQDGTGSRTVTWDSAYAFSTDIPIPTLTTTANATDILGFQYNAAVSKWQLLAVTKGF